MSAVSGKNQVTIPTDVMRAAGLAPGDDVRIRPAGPGRVELIRTDELISELAGSLDARTFAPGYLDGERDGWR